MKEEAIDIKLRFFTKVMAKDWAKQKAGRNWIKRADWLFETYKRFEPVLHNYGRFVNLENSLSPEARSSGRHPTYSKAR